MECKIEKKSAFSVIGSTKIIKGENGFTECPAFWDQHYANGDGQYIRGMYGICVDDISADAGCFKYIIADDYVPSKKYPDKFVRETIPESTWAVFPCKGPMPQALHKVNQQIYKEWLPQNPDYELAGKYNIEMYSDISKFPKGNQDENYYSEIWIPVKAK